MSGITQGINVYLCASVQITNSVGRAFSVHSRYNVFRCSNSVSTPKRAWMLMNLFYAYLTLSIYLISSFYHHLRGTALFYFSENNKSLSYNPVSTRCWAWPHIQNYSEYKRLSLCKFSDYQQCRKNSKYQFKA